MLGKLDDASQLVLSNKMDHRNILYGIVDRYHHLQGEQVIQSCNSHLFANQRNGTT